MPKKLRFALRLLFSRKMDMLHCDLPGVRKLRSGKVREVFEIGNALLIVATDRISAFDCILPSAIPRKGEVLTQLSAFWFEKLDFVANHVIATHTGAFPKVLKPFEAQLHGRSMLVKKAVPLPVECVVRGYLAGSGWRDYAASGSVCGYPLPPGLRQAEKLPETLFTPATKAESGHDENITWKECRRILGDEIAFEVRKSSIELYEYGHAAALHQGVIIADTKFEFGIVDDELILIDECLTPDSSRFWAADQYQAGASPPSFDKQIVRDYLESLDWNKTPPAPPLPENIIRKTSEKYIEAYALLTGLSFNRAF